MFIIILLIILMRERLQSSEFVGQFLNLETLPIEEYKSVMRRKRNLGMAEELLRRITSKDLYNLNESLLDFAFKIAKDPLYLLKKEEEAKSLINYIIKSNRDLKTFFELIGNLEVEDYYKLWLNHYNRLLDDLNRLKNDFKEYVRMKESQNSAIIAYYNLYLLYFEKIIGILEAHAKLPQDRIKIRARDLGSSKLFAASSLIILYFLFPLLAYVEGLDYYEAAAERAVLMINEIKIPPSNNDEFFMKIIVPENLHS